MDLPSISRVGCFALSLLALLAGLAFVADTAAAQGEGDRGAMPVDIPNDDPDGMRAELRSKGSIEVEVLFDVNRAIAEYAGPPALRSNLGVRQIVGLSVAGLQFQSMEAEASTEPLEAQIEFAGIPGAVMTVRSESQLDALLRHPLVASIAIDRGGGAILNAGTAAIIGSDRSNNAGHLGQDVRIAVLDSGIDSDHPDLADAVVHEACFVMRADSTGGCLFNLPIAIGPGMAEDDNGHGTIVAGIIASDGVVAPRGIAPDAELESIKVTDEEGNFARASQLTQALDYVLAARLSVNVVNISAGTNQQFTGSCDADFPALAATVRALRLRGVLVVASATNNVANTMGAPACLSQVIAVGATNDNPDASNYDTYASFSSISEMTDVAAPGATVTTSALGGGVAANRFGTSYAAAAVSGCIAILRNQGFISPLAIEGRLLTSSHFVGRGEFMVPRVDCSPLGGDVNCDGVVDVNDIMSVLEYLVGLRQVVAQCPLPDSANQLWLPDPAIELLDALQLVGT